MRNEPAVTADAEPTSHYVRLGGIKLHYLDWGGDSSRLLILLHGGSAHAHWWDEAAPMLTCFAHVIALDFRGHGMSEWAQPADYGPGAYLEDVVALAGHLGRKPVLVGHSMGGAVAQWVAAA